MLYPVFNERLAVRLVSKGFKVEEIEYNRSADALIYKFEPSEELKAELELLRLERLNREIRKKEYPQPKLYWVSSKVIKWR